MQIFKGDDFLRLSSSKSEPLEYYLAHPAPMAPQAQFEKFERIDVVASNLTFLLIQSLQSLPFNKVKNELVYSCF